MGKKIIRYLVIIIIVLLSLSILITVLVRIPRVQTFIVQKATGYLSNKLHTRVSIGSVNIVFFKTADLKDVYVEDQRKDTLLNVGDLKANISLFSLFDKQLKLNFTDLDNATIYFFRGRKDTDFNFQFIVNAFASKDTTTKKGGTPFKFSIDKLDLNHVKFVMRDESSANEVKVNLQQGSFSLSKMDMSVPVFHVTDASINKADVIYTDYSYLYPQEPDQPADTSVVHLNTKAFQLLCKRFKMIDCSFTMNTDTLKPAEGEFDPAHIHVTSLNMDIENSYFIKDTIKGRFNDFSAIERSGIAVKHIEANTKITPKQITLDHLSIETNNSYVKNYFQMSFHDFRAFTDFTNKVTMKGKLDYSKVSFYDIAYFAPAVKNTIDKTLLLDGEVNGPVNHLNAKKFKIKFGNSGVFDGNVELSGLPNIDETFATIDIKQFVATALDLKELLPSIRLPDNISTLGLMSFDGNYSGFMSDFVAYGTFNTAIGTLTTDVNFKVDKHDHASYSGSFSADNFNIGRFIGKDSLLGTISLKADIKGSGLRSDNISAQMKSDVSQFVFNHYNYHDLTVYGRFDRKEFNGKLSVNDKNLNLDFSGTVNFNDTIPKLDFNAQVTNAHLQNINFANKDFILNSTMQLNMRGNDIDNIVGKLNFEHTKFALDSKDYEIDSIYIVSSVNSLVKTINLKSDVLDVNLKGKFEIAGFYDSFTAMLKSYFPSWPITVTDNPEKEDLAFEFTAKNMAPFTTFFFPDISGLTNSRASGTINTSEKNISMTGFIPEIDYKNFRFQTVDLNVEVTKHTRLKMAAAAKNIQVNDSTGIKDVTMSFAVRNDSALCHLKAADSSFANRLNFSGWLVGSPDSIKFSFFKSNFYVNNMEWSIPDKNMITYSTDHILVNDLQLNGHGPPDAQISFSGVKTNTINTLTASFSNVRIEDFYNLFKIPDYSVYGILNGKLTVINPLSHLHIASTLTVDGFRLNTDSLGKLTADVALDTTNQIVNFNFNLKGTFSDADVIGKYKLYGDSALNADINLRDAKLALVSPFLTGLISGIKGNCNGKLNLSGTISKPNLTGKITIPSGEATIDYLKTHYKFSNETVDFVTNQINVHDVTVYDAYNNQATLSGKVTRDYLSNFNFDISLNTKNFLLLNTGARDNDLFYGKAFGSGKITFIGPLDNLEIDANLRSERNTVISIPISGGESVTDRSFIRFVSAGNQINKDELPQIGNSSLKLYFNLDVTPDAQINIILDQTTGEIIKGTGNGNLQMEINTAGSFNIYGTYSIENGSYVFTYKNIVNKRFAIDRGSTISWSGDPYKALIDINAIYTLKTNLSSLTSSQASNDQQAGAQTIPVNVDLKLTGSLLTPNIDFDITVPNQSSSYSDLALSRLQQIRGDKNELNKQVFALLIMNSFTSDQNSTSSLVGSSAITSLSEFFTSQLSNIFSSINTNTNVNLNYYTYSTTPISGSSDALSGKEIVADVQRKLLNDRLTVTVGGNIDVNSAPTSSQNSTTNIAGDFNIDYLLTRDGRYTLKAFRKNQYDDIAQQNINVNGVGISFKKEFDSFKEILQRENKKNKNAPVK